jgi:TolB protein
MNRYLLSTIVAACCCLSGLAQDQPTALGIFSARTDVGEVKHAGSATYDSKAQTYTLRGAGTNMWAKQDEFNFVWQKVKGDFTLMAHAKFIGEGIDPHRKLGLIIRQSLDGDSAYVDAAIHGDGLTSLQYRATKADVTQQKESELKAPDVVQLSRKNGKYSMSVAKSDGELVTTELSDVELPDEVYVGLFVCSHNADVIETAVFENVKIVAQSE